jgi:SAM-dependent methyltransferase
MQEYWGGEGGAHWVTQAEAYDRVLAHYRDALVEGARVVPGERVLDVGCGFGVTTVALARQAAPAEAVGVDISEAMIDLARRRADDAGVANVRFDVADAQVAELPPASFDVVASRFGVMFFADATAAFSNLARATKPGGRLAVLVWKTLLENEWQLLPGGAALEHVPMPPQGPPDAPGPWSLADPDRVRQVLGDAGWRDVALEGLQRNVTFPSDPREAAEFMRLGGMGQALFKDVDPETVRRAMDAVVAALATRSTPDGILLDSNAWLVTATRP